jgi:hypothetical protein
MDRGRILLIAGKIHLRAWNKTALGRGCDIVKTNVFGVPRSNQIDATLFG